MSGIDVADDRGTQPDLAVREPRQQRTREQWTRVLDAGVELLEYGGYEAFTIAALCERAGVPPRALYARAATKDALFLAVYERGMTRVATSETALDDSDGWDLPPDQRIERAVRGLVQIFAENAAFLRSVVLLSGAHPEVRRRGGEYRATISERFVTAIGPLGSDPRSGPTAHEREFCFSLIFSAMVVRTAYGPNFGLDGDIGALSGELVTLAQRYLRLSPSTTSGADEGEHYRGRMSEHRPDFGGMTVNERLSVAGSRDRFDAAIRAGDREQAVALLEQVDMSADGAGSTVDAILDDPSRYGYPGHDG